jgi:hypothetical protein
MSSKRFNEILNEIIFCYSIIDIGLDVYMIWKIKVVSVIIDIVFSSIYFLFIVSGPFFNLNVKTQIICLCILYDIIAIVYPFISIPDMVNITKFHETQYVIINTFKITCKLVIALVLFYIFIKDLKKRNDEEHIILNGEQ